MIEQVKIAITLEDNSLVIMSFVTNDFKIVCQAPTRENIDAEILKAGFIAKSWRIIQEEDIPQDRTFRNAWNDDGSALSVDMIKARDIHRDHLRVVRAEKLSALDTEYLQADEKGDISTKEKIKQRKQSLRDITKHPAIDEVLTPEDLKKVWFTE
jgi:hypothetical protein